VRQTLSDSGAVASTTSYDPWGGVTQGTVPTFGFTGELQQDDAIYLRARWYQPSAGAFLGRDPWAGSETQPISFNAYLYAYANPVTFIDPSGYRPCDDEATCQNGVSKPRIVSRSNWGALEPGEHNHCTLIGGRLPWCTKSGQKEGRYDPSANPGGYAFYSELLPGKSLAEILHTIVMHHEGDTATYDVKQVQHDHMFGSAGMWDIGYHYIIGQPGTIYEGRDVGARGNHVLLNNTGRIGVLWLGDFQPQWWDFNDDSRPTEQQVESAKKLVRWLDSKYGIEEVVAHRDVGGSEDCPGDNAMLFVEELNEVA
jgi:RHS repeat-associated protein